MSLKKLFTRVCFLAAPIALMGCCRHGSPEKRAAWVTDRVASKLEITEAQRPKLDAVRDELVSLRKEMIAGRLGDLDTFISFVESKETDKAKLKALVDKRTATVLSHKDALVAKLAELHATLDDKQKARAVEFLKHVRGRFED